MKAFVALAVVISDRFETALFQFGLDYFRVNNLWISILLLAMFAKALECVSERGIHRC